MRETRRIVAECAVEQDLLGRVRDVVVAAHHQRDAHVDVVRDHGEIVDRRSVRAEDDEVFDVLVRKGNAFVHGVVPRRLAIRHAKAHDERHARGDATRDFVGREQIASAIVLEAVLARGGRLTHHLELRCGAKASIRGAGLEQEVRIALMARETECLMHDVLVPVETEPLESFEDGALALVGAARLVRVLDAKQEGAAGLARVQPVEERGARAAHVEISRGRRSEANPRWGERISHVRD